MNDLSITNVTKNIENFHYNKAIANIYEFVNSIQKNIVSKSVSYLALETSFKNLTLLLQPFTPHLSEEMWLSLGFKDLVIKQQWPKPSKILRKKTFKIAIQINGKTRQIMEFDFGQNENEVKTQAMKSEKIINFINNKKVLNTIYVKEKILNIVTK